MVVTMSDLKEPHWTPTYKRPRSSVVLSKPERRHLLEQYFANYRSIASENPALLNQKLPREVFKELLDVLGGVLLQQTRDIAARPGPIRDFLELNRLPPSLAQLLPPDFRTFCLALNALKQWVAAEQQATDRFLLGGNARDELRTIAASCIATGKSLNGDCELHHPVRDGRPPIPLCHEAHDAIEKQQSKADASSDPNFLRISNIRRESNNSWRNLRKGCLDLLGNKVKHSTPAVGAGARAFARKVANTTGLTFEQIVEFLDSHDLGT
jgi:hypothetical protein